MVDSEGHTEPIDSIEFAAKPLFISGERPGLSGLGGCSCAAALHSATSHTGCITLAHHFQKANHPPLSSPHSSHPTATFCCLPSGVVYPKEGAANKDTGRRVDKFGPLKGFSLDFSGKAAQVGRRALGQRAQARHWSWA